MDVALRRKWLNAKSKQEPEAEIVVVNLSGAKSDFGIKLNIQESQLSQRNRATCLLFALAFRNPWENVNADGRDDTMDDPSTSYKIFGELQSCNPAVYKVSLCYRTSGFCGKFPLLTLFSR